MLFCLFYLHFAYKIGSEHQLIVGSIRSYHRPIPYDYANKNLFCSEKNSGILHQKFGDVIIGEVRMVSPYKFSLGNKIVRSQLCSKRYDDTQKVAFHTKMNSEKSEQELGLRRITNTIYTQSLISYCIYHH